MRGHGEEYAPGKPTRAASRTESRWRGLIAAVAGGMVVLAGCGLGDAGSPHTPSPHTQSPSGSSSSGSSGLPTPADGADLAACTDGRCEVQVSASAKIPVPRKLRVDSVRVQSVGSGTVTIVGRYVGDEQGGFCTGSDCSSSGSGDGFKLTLGPHSTGSQNDLSITAVAINGKFAVLRLAPV